MTTVNQLVAIFDKIHEAMDNRVEARMIFLDAAKAFDKVWHKGLHFKLRQLGVQSSLFDCFSDYLSKTKSHYKYSDLFIHSRRGWYSSGVNLRFTFFLVHFNDISEGLQSKYIIMLMIHHLCMLYKST